MIQTSPDRVSRRAVIAGLGAGALAACGRGGRDAENALVLRVATDVGSRHILTQTFNKYLAAVAAACPDVSVRLFPSGQLFYDRDMPRAILRGDIDMAAPTISTLSRVVPECGLTTLPPFYGHASDVIHRVSDGEVGQAINRILESWLNAIVPGMWLDLGPVDLFSTAPVAATRGGLPPLKIRVFAGAANVLRLRALGTYPILLPFADVPIALSTGTVDAIESTAETVATGQLWDAGLRDCLQLQSVFIQYLPLISRHFWDRASVRVRENMVRIWQDTVVAERAEAATRQAAAREACARNGMTVRLPDAATTASFRARLLPLTDDFVRRLEINPSLAARAFAEAA